MEDLATVERTEQIKKIRTECQQVNNMEKIYLSSIILEGKCSLRWGRKTESLEAHSNLNGFQTEVGSSTKERPAKILKLGHASFTECTPHFLSNALCGT